MNPGALLRRGATALTLAMIAASVGQAQGLPGPRATVFFTPSQVSSERLDLRSQAAHEGPWVRRLGTMKTRARIGEAEDARVFSMIIDLTFFEGGVLIVDYLGPSVTAFSLDGSELWSFDSVGDGPGDIRRPLSAIMAGPSLWISQPATLKRFTVVGSGRPSLAETRRFGANPYRQCIGPAGHVVQLFEPGEGSLARVYDRSGADTGRRFGRLAGGDVAQAGAAFADAMVGCLPDGGVILAPRTGIPEVRAFDGDGTVRWRLLLEGMRLPETWLVDGGFGSRIGPEGYDRVESVVPLNETAVLIQFAEMSLDALAAASYDGMLSVVVNPATGRIMESTRRLPAIRATGSGCIAVVPKGLVPMVEIRC